MKQYLNNGTVKLFSIIVSFIVGLEFAITGFNLFSSLDTTVLSLSVRELFAEIGLLCGIFGGFLVALFKRNKRVVVLQYIQFLIALLVAYLFIGCGISVVYCP